METTEKMVEVARFQYPEQAQALVTLLQSEGIDCYIRNEFSSRIMAGYVDIGGARVELLESSVAQALEIMQEHGYELPKEDELPEQVKTLSGWTRHIPILRHLSLEKQLFFFLLLIAILLAALVFANRAFV